MQKNQGPSIEGYYYAIIAMMMWGVFPIYWRSLESVNTLEVLSHRTVWCAIFTLLVLSFQGKLGQKDVFSRSPKEWLVLTVSAVMIASNWGLFIWAVVNDFVIEASLGYFLSPLMSIMLGRLIFAEQIKKLHWLAITLAAMGVLIQIISVGVTPWMGLLIAASFSGYGVLRKLSTADSLTGLLIETLILAPIAFIYLAWLATVGNISFITAGPVISLLLVMGGVVTAVPLMLYVASAKLLSLSVVSFLFYINPTIQFLLGRFLYNESFNTGQLTGFTLIWIGLIVYTTENFRNRRRKQTMRNAV